MAGQNDDVVLPRTPDEEAQGLYVEEGSGSVIAYLAERGEGLSLRKDPPGTSFSLCLPDGTFVAGDVKSPGSRLDAVREAAKEAFKGASFNPLNGGDRNRVQENLSAALGDQNADFSGIMTISSDPRCTKAPLSPSR
ncbi:MAG: hypothetical protein H6862_00755 [Rhodospirillales bacterium]|nr:hypothetical protein [Rhodospirillales bacterium]